MAAKAFSVSVVRGNLGMRVLEDATPSSPPEALVRTKCCKKRSVSPTLQPQRIFSLLSSIEALFGDRADVRCLVTRRWRDWETAAILSAEYLQRTTSLPLLKLRLLLLMSLQMSNKCSLDHGTFASSAPCYRRTPSAACHLTPPSPPSLTFPPLHHRSLLLSHDGLLVVFNRC